MSNNTYDIDLLKNSSFENKMGDLTMAALMIKDAIDSEKTQGTDIYFKNFRTLQIANRMGIASKILDSYSQVHVNRETGITISVHGTGVTGATVDEVIFTGAIGTAETMEYEFIFDGDAWRLDGVIVVLASYGIAVTGTPAADDVIVVHETATDVLYDILGIDHDIPEDPNFTHTITLGSHYVKNYGSLAYKRPQGLIYVDPAQFPNGLTAGTLYYVTSLHGAYDLTTKEDGIFGFTPTVNVPADGLIRHTAMGAYQSSSASYTKARVLAGKFVTYGTRATGRQQIESLDTIECDGTSGTNLGTITGENYAERSAAYLNMTRRNAYGSNAYIGSDERAHMQSRSPKGAVNGVYQWQIDAGGLGIFDLPSTFNAAGNLYGMDPALLAVIGPVRKRTYLHAVDRADQSVKYVDSAEIVWPLSMLEAGLGTTNDGVYENAVDHEGNVKTAPYDYFKRRTTNAERIKYQGGAARAWWLRSPLPSYCCHVRIVNSSGALHHDHADNAYGELDACAII